MITFAMTGGCIINRRFSICDDPRFRDVVEIIREADVSFSHLEGTIAGAEGHEVFPAAEAGWTWIRMPRYFAEELKWAGFDIVSHASNHALDYMYGGLYATWETLEQAGLPWAGTGGSLAAARRPAYLDTPRGRVALVSASSSTPGWARAADPIRADRGRPGANQIRTIRTLDRETAETILTLARKAGDWITEVDDDFAISPAGLHNTVTRYRITDGPGIGLIADRDDVEANLRAIREARARADFVIFHIHNHEWDPAGGLAVPPAFTRALAHETIDAGADIFIAEGAHALLRGIEIYKGKPIFYDPGDLFKDGNSKTRPLSEYYWMQGLNPETGRWEITTADSRRHTGFKRLPVPSNPPGGYNTGRVLAVIVPVCVFDDDGNLAEIRIHPARHLQGSQVAKGLPGLETGDEARAIIDYLAELSAPFGAAIEYADGVGVIRPQADPGPERKRADAGQ